MILYSPCFYLVDTQALDLLRMSYIAYTFHLGHESTGLTFIRSLM